MEKLKFFLLTILCIGFLEAVEKPTPPPSEKIQTDVKYKGRDFGHLINLQVFSEKLLKMHFTLYNGYVKNCNLLYDLLKKTSAQDYAYQALKRRFGFEFDGMRLHELYFENLGGNEPLNSGSPLYRQIVADFGSFEAWKADFIATGSLRGVGWAILYLDPKENRLFNVWVSDHELGHLATGEPLLVMDVWEHAFMPEFGLERGEYIKKFFNAIDWKIILKRFQNVNK